MAETHSIPPRISRFNFDGLRDFGEPFMPAPVVMAPVVEEAPPPPLPPTFTEADIEAARAGAFAEGVTKGIADGRAQIKNEGLERDEALKAALASLTTQAAELQGLFRESYEHARSDTITLALAISRQICSSLFEKEPAAMFESLVERALPTLIRQVKITATVHPKLEMKVKDRLELICRDAGYEGIIEVRTSDQFGLHDARLTWADGRAEVEMAEVWVSIEKMFNDRAGPKRRRATDMLPPPEKES